MAQHAVLPWTKFECSWTPLMHSYCSYYQQGAVPKLYKILHITEICAPYLRASYVREATRFKSTLADVNDPSRNQQVIQGAVDAAPSVHLPQVVAETVYEGIINSSVLFEECIVSATFISEVTRS
jgi:chorismate mutase